MHGELGRRIAGGLSTVALLGLTVACGGDGAAETVTAEEWADGFCAAAVDLADDFDALEVRLGELEATGFETDGDALRSVDAAVDTLEEQRELYGDLVARATERQPEGEEGTAFVTALRAARTASEAQFAAAVTAFREVDRSRPEEATAAFDLADEAAAPIEDALAEAPDDVAAALDGRECGG